VVVRVSNRDQSDSAVCVYYGGRWVDAFPVQKFSVLVLFVWLVAPPDCSSNYLII
jgi:hypothetical protein